MQVGSGLILIQCLFSFTAFAQSNVNGLIPTSSGNVVSIKKALFPNALQLGGVKIKAWRGMYEMAIQKALKRDPTPDELSTQQENLDQLVQMLVKDIELDGDGNQTELEFDRSRLKDIKILQFKVLRKEQIDLRKRPDLEALIYCAEEGVCFVPILYTVFSYLDVAYGHVSLGRRVAPNKKFSLRCPRFKDRSSQVRSFQYPYLVIARYRKPLLTVKRKDGQTIITTHDTKYYHSQEDSEADKETE